MPDLPIQVAILKKAVNTYLTIAYPGGNIPPIVQERLASLEPLPDLAHVPESCFEVSVCGGHTTYTLRLGQPIYPHMKLIVEECPTCGGQGGENQKLQFRADAHDSHLHAPPGSPDAAPLAALRAVNKQLTEAIETAWVAQGIPTFRDFLRQEIARRKNLTPL